MNLKLGARDEGLGYVGCLLIAMKICDQLCELMDEERIPHLKYGKCPAYKVLFDPHCLILGPYLRHGPLTAQPQDHRRLHLPIHHLLAPGHPVPQLPDALCRLPVLHGRHAEADIRETPESVEGHRVHTRRPSLIIASSSEFLPDVFQDLSGVVGVRCGILNH